MSGRRRIWRFFRDGAVSVAVALAMLAALEVGLRLFAPQVPVNRTDALGPRGVPDDTLGHRYRPGAEAVAEGPEFEVTYRINRHGHRDETPYSEAGSPDSTRILILGDSFAFGAGSEYEDIWPAVAERRLHEAGIPADVVNAGVEGYDTRSEFESLRRTADTVRPDAVVIAFLANDLFTNIPMSAPIPSAQNRTLHRASRIHRELHTIALAKRILFQSDRVYARTYVMTARGRYFTAVPDERVHRQLRVTQELLGAAHAFCRERGIAFAVLSIPQQFQVIMHARGFAFDGIDVDWIDRELSAFAQAQGFAWIQTLPALVDAAKDGEALYHRVDGHLTRAGNHVVAGALVAALPDAFGLTHSAERLTGDRE